MNNIDSPVVLHKGVYKPTATVAEAIFMIMGMTIGAGILGLPYVVSKVGLLIGLPMILVLGLTMLLLNLMVGDIAVRTGQNFQLPGFAGRYLGPWAKGLMSMIIILSGFGALLAYVIGEGAALASLFGGEPAWWSVFFWTVASFLVWRGLGAIKKTTKVLSFCAIVIVAGLSFFLLPKIQPVNLSYFDLGNIFLPFGVILFALHATPAIAEAHALLPGSQRHFRKAVIIGTLVPIFVYLLFTLAVVGFSGLSVTEVATVGLAGVGRAFSVFANLFAVLAMGTGFMGFGLALKQTLVWDHGMKKNAADLAVILTPLVLFLLGLRSFVAVLDVVGGLFIGLEALLIVLICRRARQRGDMDGSRFGLRYLWLAAIPVIVIFSLASVYSFLKLMN